jgi:hypothetical protein
VLECASKEERANDHEELRSADDPRDDRVEEDVVRTWLRDGPSIGWSARHARTLNSEKQAFCLGHSRFLKSTKY